MNQTASLCATVVCAAAAAGLGPFARAEGSRQHKDAMAASIERHAPELVALSRDIWGWAETALHETRSSAALADYAQAHGFRVTRGVADLPTAFVAEYGAGRPIVGVLGEFDALPGISQQAVPRQQPLEPGAAGHGCGHNLFGPGSLGAALAIKELIEAGAVHGTVRFYGTPAEEAVGGKLYMLRAGLFQDLDVCLAWHPDSENKADTESSQALVDFVVEFQGRSAHAAFDPWNGRSAQDGLEVFTFALNLMREHVKPTVRMHYAMLDGAKVPNVVPDHAKLWCWVRDSNRQGVEEVLTRLRDVAQGAALAAGVQSELRVQSGDYEMLVNMTGARALYSNLMRLGPPEFTAAEQEFARELQRGGRRRHRGAERADRAAGPESRPAGGRVDRRRRRQLERADPACFDRDRAARDALARMAGRRVRGDGDRPAGHAVRRKGAGHHDGGPVRGRQVAPGSSRRVRCPDARDCLPGVHPGRPTLRRPSPRGRPPDRRTAA